MSEALKPVPEQFERAKILPFRKEGISMMIYEDLQGITHIDRDFRVFEADRENPQGHENRIYRLFEDNPNE